MNETIQDGVAEGWVADNVVPMFDGDLAGDDGGGATVAIIEDLQKVAPFGRIKNRKAPVIEDQQVGLGVAAHQLGEAAVAMGQAQLFQQARQAQVTHAVAISAGLVGQGAGQPGLAAAGGAGDQQVARMAQPVAAGQLRDQAAVQAPAGAPVDVLDAGRAHLELGCLEQPGHAAVVAPGNLALHQQRQPVVEGQFGRGGSAGLVLQGMHHAVQAQDAQLVQGVFVEHGWCRPSAWVGSCRQW